MEDCLKEISESPADDSLLLAHLEDAILHQADNEEGQDGVTRRRGAVLCDSDEVADALLRWMKQGCQSLEALNPAKLDLPSRKSRRDAEELIRRGHYVLVAVWRGDCEREISGVDYSIDYTTNSSLLQSSTLTTPLCSVSTSCSSMSPDSPVYELRCLSCHADSTRSSELRLIKEHCITVDKAFADRAVFEECMRTKTLQHWQKKDRIKCGKCLSDWGVRASYKGHSYNVLIAVSFEMLGPDASCLGPFKNWNEVPFEIHRLRHRPRPVDLQATTEQ